MQDREYIQYVEIDFDYCNLTFGTAPCTASLSATVSRKCFNTYATCPVKNLFVKGVKTQRFVNNRASLPVGFDAYPTLRAVSSTTSTVNLAGSDPRMSAVGRRADLRVTLNDFVDDDSGFDKYQTQRVSGSAQFSGIGYRPEDFGTYWTRRKAQFPFYAGRPIRLIEAYIENNAVVVISTKHFIITDIKGPDDNNTLTVDAKDILALADDKKALAPKPSRGKLGAATTLSGFDVFSLTPTGIGAEYPTSGYASIGSEVVSYTRSGDSIALTGRGLEGSVASTHNVGDTFQEALRVQSSRVDDFLYTLLTTYAKINPAFCPKTTKWEPEITKWSSSLLLDTVITKPTGVSQLIGELADLGFSIWWDSEEQEILLAPNHPIESELITDVSDDLNIKAISQEDRDEDRITQIHFYTRQTDPTKDYKDKSNYNQINVILDPEAEGPNAYNDTKVREVFCRWLNNGADAVVRVLAIRLLKRFNKPPLHFNITLDANDGEPLKLADILNLSSRVLTDDIGVPIQKYFQIYKKESLGSGKDVKVSVQQFDYQGRYGVIMENTASPDYDVATTEEKARGAFFVATSSPTFSDNTGPYLFI